MVLQKKENNDFHFQKMFLEPFEHIFKETKDFIMMSDVVFYFNYLVKNDAKNIKSGWNVILNIINFVVNEDWKNNETIIEFISCLCSLAKKQFLNSGVTKIFLLQKVVEVGELNINRDFFIFSKIWKIISEFLVEIVLGKNVDDGRDAMNSLRQLS